MGEFVRVGELVRRGEWIPEGDAGKAVVLVIFFLVVGVFAWGVWRTYGPGRGGR
ncbi:hypothetical protein [Streptomyces californicus]|uniref:hypothetical protein n=1 Tax=Streptomyces californicus TaxID=67351 RepID=UPI003674A81D